MILIALNLVSRGNRDDLLLNVNAVGPFISCDSLESLSKFISLIRVRKGEGEGAMALAVSSLLLLAQLSSKLAIGVGFAVG